MFETRGGSGDPTVLVHGSLMDHHNWDAVVGPLAEALQILVYDRRGYGSSSGPPRTHAVREDASDLAGLLTATELYPAHLVTHSYAGAVAVRLASERPELVRSIVMHEPPMFGLLEDDPASAPEAHRLAAAISRLREVIGNGELERAAREIVEQFAVQPGAWDRLRPEVRRSAERHVGLWAEEFADPEAVHPDRDALRNLVIPILVTSGDESPPVLNRIARALVTQLRNGTYRQIPGVGHVPQVTSPHQYVGVLGSFLLERNVPTV